jgi:hypothetical protein
MNETQNDRRVVVITGGSDGIDADDLDMASGYDGLRTYKASKLANVLFTRELARCWEPLRSAPQPCTPAWSDRNGARRDLRTYGPSSTHPFA